MSPIRILHFSDLHGRAFAEAARLIDRLTPHWVVLTGDMVVGHLHHRPETQHRKQADFWSRHRACFLREGLTTTFLRGNHEGPQFLDPELQGRVPANLTAGVGFLEGIPAEFGPWGFPRELDTQGLQAELEAQGAPSLILSHVPPFGSLDHTRHGTSVGHRPLAERIRRASGAPTLVLCGHVHESFGTLTLGPTRIINAAGGYAFLEWDPATGHTDLLAQEVLVRYRPWRGFLEVLRGGRG